MCKLPREQGNCGTYSNRWWFNAKTGNCEEFIYSGCQGNANNFETYKECQDYCRDARSEPQCIQGTALTDSNGNFIICGGSSAASTTCPANHYCYYDGTTYGCCPTQGRSSVLSLAILPFSLYLLPLLQVRGQLWPGRHPLVLRLDHQDLPDVLVQRLRREQQQLRHPTGLQGLLPSGVVSRRGRGSFS